VTPLYQQKLALISPISGGRLVGVVRQGFIIIIIINTPLVALKICAETDAGRHVKWQ
jgi:hypothetical protein